MKSDRQKRVLFFLSSLEVGGTETYLLRFLNFVGGVIQAIVICKSGHDGPLLPDYKMVGARVVRLNLGNSLSHRYIHLYRFLRQNHVDCVCDLTGNFGGLPVLTAWLAGVDTRIVFYRNFSYRFKPTLPRLVFARVLGALALRCSTAVLSNSEAALDSFQVSWRKHPGKFRVIRNPAPLAKPVDPRQRKAFREKIGLPESAFVIAHVGRVASSKNHDFLFAVADRMVNAYSNFHFVFCGRGLEEVYGSRLTDTELGSRFHLFEYRPDVLDLLFSVDAFFFPSLSEGMPNALIEAMAAGCPCIASDIPPIREIFPLKYSHYLVDPYDVQGATIKLLELSESAAREQYGQDLREWAMRHFDPQKNFGAFLSALGREVS